MKADLPIIGQPASGNSLLSLDWLRAKMRRIDANAKAMANRLKIQELRRSCGVELDSAFTVSVRLPAQYTVKR